MPMDVMAEVEVEAVFDRVAQTWGTLDFLVHSIAFSTKEGGPLRPGHRRAPRRLRVGLVVPAHGPLAEPLMQDGGTLFTMTYYDFEKVENYNIMGVAKAALECAVRYLAAELGPMGIRVHAISPGPLATCAASAFTSSTNCSR